MLRAIRHGSSVFFLGRSCASDGVALPEIRRCFCTANEIEIPLLDSPSQESVIYVLKKLDKFPQKAIGFLDCARNRYGFKPSAAVYNVMLRILGKNKDFAKDFWIIARNMREDGHCFDHGTYFTLVSSFKKQEMRGDASALAKLQSSSSIEEIQAAIDIVKGFSEEWTEAEGDAMSASKLVLSEGSVIKVLKEAKDRPLLALGFFRWAEQRPGYSHGSSAYNQMARVLGWEGTIDKFFDLAMEMKKLGHEIDFDTYVKISRRFQKCKLLEPAVQLYELMMDGPYKPSVQDCGLLLRRIAMADPPELELVSRVVQKFESQGNSLTKSVYDGIHRSLTSAGRFKEADQIMEKMKASGFEADNITYSQLVHGLCKAGKVDEARAVVEEMESMGCVPDLKTWTVLIKGHLDVAVEPELDGSLSLLADMVGRGRKPDGQLVDCVVTGLCRHGRGSAAYALVLEMDKAGVRPWQATFKLLIENCLGRGQLEEALKLLRRMRELKYPPYGDPVAAYIAKVGTMEDALEFFRSMSGKSSPSSSIHLKIFRGLFKEGRFGEARDLLFRCPHHIRKHKDVAKLFGSAEISSPVNISS
ncbi:pentatricopeptide repeat (PPR) superfamily protein [Wolffia australiana]